MSSKRETSGVWRDLQAETIRQVRRFRSMTAAEVARGMGMALRSYQHFESGKGKFLNRDNIFRFAEATDSDAEAIIFAMDIGDPLFAVYCADNKFMKVFHFAVKDFNRRAGPRIGALRTAALITTFSVLFEDLTAQAEKEGRDVAEWLVEYERRLGKLRTQRD